MARKPKPRDPAREAIDSAMFRLREHFPAVVILLERTAEDIRDNGPRPPIVEYDGGPSSCAGVLWQAYEHMEEVGLPMPDDDEEGADK
jgi:hypothetical protein